MSNRSVPARDAAVLAVLCMLLGGVLSWIIFSSPDGIRVPREAGNAADWIAALAGVAAAGGTWVIGAAANRFQREADERRAMEIKEQKREQVEIRGRRFDLMLVRLKRTETIQQAVAEYESQERLNETRASKCSAAITAVSRLCKTLAWPAEEVVMLPQDCQIHIANLEVHLLSLDAVSELGLNPMRFGDVEHLRDCVATLVNICAEIRQISRTLSGRISELRG
ncbi:MAG: hypothetical protein ACN6OP_19390 [Pseudomonadales bacterium]